MCVSEYAVPWDRLASNPSCIPALMPSDPRIGSGFTATLDKDKQLTMGSESKYSTEQSY